ncbi:MAG: rhomboid family intramembrane serine protease, partial [Thiohalorhabdaceae bacterium]
MIPLYDDNPAIRPPIVTVGLIALCIGIFLVQSLFLGRAEVTHVVYWFGAIPGLVTGNLPQPQIPQYQSPIPAQLTLLTSIFLHGGFLHLAGNMLFLWIFG